MAGEGAEEMVGGFDDAVGGVRQEQQEGEEASNDLDFFSEDGIPDLSDSPETAGRLPPRAPTPSSWVAGSRGSGQGTGAPLYPPLRLAAGGRHSNVAPRRPERGAPSRSRSVL